MKMSSIFCIIIITFCMLPTTGYAQDVLDMGEDTITSKVPKPPTDIERMGIVNNLEKAIELKLEESFIIKITESMQKDPF